MLKSNEILTLFALIDKMNDKELRDLLILLTDTLIFKKENEIYNNPLFKG